MAKNVKCPKCGEIQPLTLKTVDEHGRIKCKKCGFFIHIKRRASSGNIASATQGNNDLEEVKFKRQFKPDEEMDLTPMVDVTFLLLIFFMVTASYSMQKSLDLPAAEKAPEAAQTRTIQDNEDENDNIIAKIDADNTIWIGDAEAPSDQEIITKIRESKEGPPGTSGSGPTKLLILCHPDSDCETTVRVHDAGTAVGMEKIEWKLTSDDE